MFAHVNEIKSMQDAVERIKNVSDSNAFKSMVRDLRTYMKNLGMDFQALAELEQCCVFQPSRPVS